MRQFCDPDELYSAHRRSLVATCPECGKPCFCSDRYGDACSDPECKFAYGIPDRIGLWTMLDSLMSTGKYTRKIVVGGVEKKQTFYLDSPKEVDLDHLPDGEDHGRERE